MTDAVIELHAHGDIVEGQSYLNGTRYLLIEGIGSDGAGAHGVEQWEWTLAVTIAKESGAPIDEGDLALVAADRSWYADITGGAYTEMVDEETDALFLDIRLELARREDGESSETWLTARAHVSIRANDCVLDLELAGAA